MVVRVLLPSGDGSGGRRNSEEGRDSDDHYGKGAERLAHAFS